jgi:hypothetical protein
LVLSPAAADFAQTSSLLRFAHKTQKNRLKADFLSYKLRSDQRSAQPDNRGIFAASSAKNPQVQQAASEPDQEITRLTEATMKGPCRLGQCLGNQSIRVISGHSSLQNG